MNRAPVKVCLGGPTLTGMGMTARRLLMSEGLAVALYVAVQNSEKLDFDIVWPKIKPFTESLCSHDYWLTPYFIKAFRP
jgi:hypothetical protein